MDQTLTPPSPPAVATSPIIAELKGISKSFTIGGGHELKVLDNIDLAVHEGELLALLGQSGSGKSTLLRCLTGLAQPTTGQVQCYGEPLDGINPHASIVFQTFALYPWLTVEQNVAVGLMSKRISRAEKAEAVDRAIELIGLSRTITPPIRARFPAACGSAWALRGRFGLRAKDPVPGRGLQRARCIDGGKLATGSDQPLAKQGQHPEEHLHGHAQHPGGRGDGHADLHSLSTSRTSRPDFAEQSALSARSERCRVRAVGEHHP